MQLIPSMLMVWILHDFNNAPVVINNILDDLKGYQLAIPWVSTSHLKTSCFCSFTEIFGFHRLSKQCPILHRLAQGMKTVNLMLLRQAATASLEPGKSTGAPRKKDHSLPKSALFRKVCEDHFNIARTLTERMSNLYGECVGRKMMNNRLAARGHRACRFLRKPLLTANHRRLRLVWAWRWQNLSVNIFERSYTMEILNQRF